MIEYEKAYRQGEILIFKIKSINAISSRGLQRIRIKDGCIREGEKEGHKHQLKNASLDLFASSEDKVQEADTGVFKVLDETAEITHPEHKKIKLPKGDYMVKVQKEATGAKTYQSVKD